jgi:hypothetical protein
VTGQCYRCVLTSSCILEPPRIAPRTMTSYHAVNSISYRSRKRRCHLLFPRNTQLYTTVQYRCTFSPLTIFLQDDSSLHRPSSPIIKPLPFPSSSPIMQASKPRSSPGTKQANGRPRPAGEASGYLETRNKRENSVHQASLSNSS